MEVEMDKLVEAQDAPSGRNPLLEETVGDVLTPAVDPTGYQAGSDSTASPRGTKRQRSDADTDSVTKLEAPGIPCIDPHASLLPTRGPSGPSAAPTLAANVASGESFQVASRAQAAEEDKGYESDIEPEPSTNKTSESEQAPPASVGNGTGTHGVPSLGTRLGPHDAGQAASTDVPTGLRKFEEGVDADGDGDGKLVPEDATPDLIWATATIPMPSDVLPEVCCRIDKLQPGTRGMTAAGLDTSAHCILASMSVPHGGTALTAQEAVDRIPVVLSRSPAVFERQTGGETQREGVRNALEMAFLAADMEAVTDAASAGVTAGGSVTVSMLQIGQTIHVANVGDCVAALVRPDGVQQLSREHTPNDPRERERVETQGGSVMRVGPDADLKVVREDGKDGLGVTRALGDVEYEKMGQRLLEPRPDVCSFTLQGNESAALLVTHSVWSALGARRLGEMVRVVLGAMRDNKSTTPPDAAKYVAKAVAQAARNDGASGTCAVMLGLLPWA